MNIIELIENRLDDRFIDAAASETGLSPDETRTASRAAVPALLAGLLGAITKPGGTKALGSMLKQGLLGDGSPIAGATAARSTAGSGIGSVTSLLGEGKLSSLINAIGGFSGIGHSQSRSLIGMVFPVVMGVLGRDQRGGTRSPEGIARLLGSQKREIADAIPASVASSLRSAGMLDALEEEPQRPRTAASTRTAESARRHTTETPRPVERKRNWLWPVAAGVAALALVVWGLTRVGDDEPDRRAAADVSDDTTQVAAVAPSDIDLTVGDVDLRESMTSVVDRTSQSLRGVTDAQSAEAAMPTLSAVNEDLDEMMPLVERLPEPAQNAFADVARDGYGQIRPEIARVESMAAVPDGFKQSLSELRSKLESMFSRGRG